MKTELVVELHSAFERMAKTHVETGTEFWLARDLQTVLGYARWENFTRVIEKAREACRNAGFDEQDHFLEVTKMVDLGSGSQRQINDLALTRYACYLIAQNGDPSKDPIAFAQTYFVCRLANKN